LFNNDEYTTLKPQKLHSYRGTRIAQIDKSNMVSDFRHLFSGHSSLNARGRYANLRKLSVRKSLMASYENDVVAGGHSYFPVGAFRTTKKEL